MHFSLTSDALKQVHICYLSLGRSAVNQSAQWLIHPHDMNVSVDVVRTSCVEQTYKHTTLISRASKSLFARRRLAFPHPAQVEVMYAKVLNLHRLLFQTVIVLSQTCNLYTLLLQLQFTGAVKYTSPRHASHDCQMVQQPQQSKTMNNRTVSVFFSQMQHFQHYDSI